MLRAEESSNFAMEGCSEHGNAVEDDFADGLSIDLDMLFDIIDEGRNSDFDALQNYPDESLKRVPPNGEIPGPGNQGNDIVHPDTLHSSYSPEVSDSIIGVSRGSTINQGTIFSHRVQGSPASASSASLKGWISAVPTGDTCSAERDSFSLPTCGTASFSQRDNDSVMNFGDKFEANTQQADREIRLTDKGAEIKSEDISKYSRPESEFYKYGTFGQNRTGTTGLSEHNSFPSLQTPVVDANICLQDTSKETIYRGTEAMMDFSAAKYDPGTEYSFVPNYSSQFHSTNDEWKNHVKNEEGEFPSESACSSTKMEPNGDGGISEKSSLGVSMSNFFDIEGWNCGYETNDYASSVGCSLFDANGCRVAESAQMQRLDCSHSYIYGEDKVNDKKHGELIVPSISLWHSDVINDNKIFHEDSRSSISGISSSLSGHKIQNLKDEKEDSIMLSKKVCCPPDYTNGNSTPSMGNGNVTMINSLHRHFPLAQPFASINNHLMSNGSRVSKVSPESSHSNFSEKSVIEDDPDICIIEDISHPAPSSQPQALRNNLITSQRSTISANCMGVAGSKSKAKDERLLLQLLQDLSQPKSEMNPPDGLLSVSLLRHQKIALSWMVQKETDSTRCSGGILADDQGLGKTISTISLILKERPPSHKASPVKQDVTETLNLDEDDDVPPVLSGVKELADATQVLSNETPTRSKKALVAGRGRPAAGTLIVCPTSVLRQWDDELRNKVTSKANLSVLVYHGSNRTKDPCELARYDVVLTTYSIVSMEVPKQPRADEDDDERGKSEEDGIPVGLSSNKKRKYPPSSDKKHSNKKGSDSAVLESLARPLAKVGWFRVVLDEAQSIKNHRTQVARACWGLRAKRRWCLSGTPIQNAIDDLYSYFRFLKYDPFDVYKLFCSNIKAPINRSPANGYRKLQAVLKTIMLRRTKGTLLDGEPIIKLPPKSIELKKVDFSLEERDFYSRLEADSRAQFEEYAAAGTVKQNYVNILLMLLRLRQACDHPFLVKGADSRSFWSSSVETANKLPQQEKEHLLRCLEASLAICGICNDPPEDAVVAKCGHVFCNQCLCEHLTADENQCPNTNCKTRLNVSSVFSKATLNSCLHDQSCKDSSDTIGPKVESCSEGLLYNSSKIRATLDILQSLCGPKDCTSGNSSTQMSDEYASPVENSIATHVVKSLKDDPEKPILDAAESSKPLIKVVGQKALVFSQWTRMLDLLEGCLKNTSIKYRRLDGTMSVTARDKAVTDFKTLPEVTVMIMSLKAASLGLNMVAACHVLLLDLWWNPTTEDQAIDRAHRIGQTRPVTVLRLTVRDTVEDRILALQEKKREMVASAFGEDGTGGQQTRLTVEDLKYLFMM